MGNAWAVTTEKLTTSATVIEEKTNRYHAEYEKLYTEVQNLKATQWQGVASDTFNQKLDSYRSTFEDLEKVLLNFVEDLRTRAKNYEVTEDSITDGANSL